jgi:arylsulfatase A-like enzyme
MPERASRRNVLLLITDQHRADTLGCYGNSICETPALDALAAAGTRFDLAFTPTAICTPARASLVTGVHPFRHKLLANFERNVGYIEELDDTFPSFAFALRDAGYRAGHVGKWHVGKQHGPDAFGFDGTHFPGWGNPVHHPEYEAWLAERGYPLYRLSEEIRGTFPNGQPGNLLAGVLEQPVEATFEAFLADRAISRLREDADAWRRDGTPFFLGVHWFGPHLPYCVPREVFERYDPSRIELPRSIAETFANKPRVQAQYSAHWAFDSLSLDDWRRLTAAYWGYVSMIDAQVGRVLDAVRELGLWDDTAVLFTADHGEFTGAHRLHDKGPAMYDDIYRIPFLARVPGAPEGRVERRFASFLDLTPTILDLAGIEVPEYMDGRSLVPLIRREDAPWRDAIFAEFHGHHFPYPQRMIRTERYKLVVNPSDINELYDLEADPDELHNRWAHPELRSVRRELLGRLYDELRTRGDNFYHWMTTMEEVGDKSYDTSLSQLDEPAGRTATP